MDAGLGAAAYTVNQVLYGLIDFVPKLGMDIGRFSAKQDRGFSDIPILGEVGKGLGENSAKFATDPNFDNGVQAFGSVSGAFLTVVAPVKPKVGGKPKAKNNVENQSGVGVAKVDGAGKTAKELYDDLPPSLKSKTVATDGKTQTISGWKKPPKGYTDVQPEKVMIRSNEIGHKLKPAGALDQGISGKYSASHAEKKVLTENPKATVVEVSRTTCSDCKGFISKEAKKRGESITVKDPTGIKVYNPNGTIDIK